MSSATIFSVIIPTRNRPELFRAALRSVTEQSCKELEIVVVIDGPDDNVLSLYRAIVEQASRPVKLHVLPVHRNGHGAGYARNYGAENSTGDYLCFLDDDDCWTDPDYLERVRTRVLSHHDRPELHLSNQAAFRAEVMAAGPIWLEDVADDLVRARRERRDDGTFDVSADDLLASGRFCHLNTLIVHRKLFEGVGGLDETILWEEDHDFFLRLIDSARSILYAPEVVARHNIPDRTKSVNVTTSMSELQRRLYQLRAFEKAAILATNPAIRAHGKLYCGYTLKRIARILVSDRDFSAAYYCARTALGAVPTAKWAIYTVALGVRAALTGRRVEQRQEPPR